MIVSFDVDAVEKWANFSGDYNPIHFDPDAAEKVSGDGLVVHGMLVLLPVKQLMAQRAALSESGLWTRLQSSFRLPVPRSHKIEINVRQLQAKTRYSVARDDGDAVYFEGLLSRALPPDPLTGYGEFHFDRKNVRERWEYFLGSFQDIVSTWIFIDALIFSEFVERNVPDLIDEIRGANAGNGHAGTQSPVVVQTTQCVWLDQAALDALVFPQSFDLTYRYKIIDRLTDGARVMGRAGLEAWLNGSRVLYSEVGLLLTK
jgi:hypothetical protein